MREYHATSKILPIGQYPMLSQDNNKALVEDGRFTQDKYRMIQLLQTLVRWESVPCN